MHTANPWKSYREVTTMTAPPGQIILMLYEGALGALERARSGFSINDPAEANMAIHNNLNRALEIIRELNGALNMELGGELASTMRRLYDYFERRLLESNLRKNQTGTEEVIGHLSGLRDAWAAMLNNESLPVEQLPARHPAHAAT